MGGEREGSSGGEGYGEECFRLSAILTFTGGRWHVVGAKASASALA